jgi:hypothetical protein
MNRPEERSCDRQPQMSSEKSKCSSRTANTQSSFGEHSKQNFFFIHELHSKLLNQLHNKETIRKLLKKLSDTLRINCLEIEIELVMVTFFQEALRFSFKLDCQLFSFVSARFVSGFSLQNSNFPNVQQVCPIRRSPRSRCRLDTWTIQARRRIV